MTTGYRRATRTREAGRDSHRRIAVPRGSRGVTMPNDLSTTLQTLTSVPSTEHPFLSIYLDWQPDGSGQRPVLRVLQESLDLIATQIKERDGNLESFETDRQRIMDYLTTEAPADAKGL